MAMLEKNFNGLGDVARLGQTSPVASVHIAGSEALPQHAAALQEQMGPTDAAVASLRVYPPGMSLQLFRPGHGACQRFG